VDRSIDDGESVTCMTVANAALLPYIKGILDAGGVGYWVKNDGLQNLLGWGSIGLGFNKIFGPPVVMVRSDQLDYARELLRPFEPGASRPVTGSRPPRCSHCSGELDTDSAEEPLANCYHCGWPLESVG
jgi:hypothetical protein